jgi:hypothetical protein
MAGIWILFFSIFMECCVSVRPRDHYWHLTCEVEYLKYFSMEKLVSWFDFNSPDVEVIIAHLSNVDWTVFDEENFKQCVGRRFYDLIYESFGMHIPKLAVDNLAVSFIVLITTRLKHCEVL